MGQLIQNPSTVPVSVAADWETLLNVNSAGNVGFNAITLTNWDAGTLAPAIAAGSMIEINGSIAYFQNEEAIGPGQAGAVCYLWFTVTGTNVSASWDATVPAWNPAKNGWYSGISRSSGHVCYQTGGAYSEKFYINPHRQISFKVFSGTTISGGVTFTQPHRIPNGEAKIFSCEVFIKSSTSYIPVTGFAETNSTYSFDNTNVYVYATSYPNKPIKIIIGYLF